jgi:hypothetical protein
MAIDGEAKHSEGPLAMTSNDEKSATHADEMRETLERFVVDNDDLLTLESRIGKFNIFDALSITHVEIRHSNFLAFILDPAESHGQGQLFLKAILMDLLKHAPAELRPLSPIDLDGIDLRGVEVRREWKNIDLLIICKEPRFAVAIENKVGSREHSDQLARYQKTVADHYADLPTLYIYLTPDGDEPSEESWIPYTYADIHRVFIRVRQTYQNAIGDEVRIFLDHYLNILGTRFMNDEELDKLCRQIHKNHRQALELIWERVGNPESGVISEVATTLEDDHRWNVVWQMADSLNFVPRAWLDWSLPIGTEYDDERVWLVLKFRLDEGELITWLELQGIDDVAKRSQIADLLLNEAQKCGFKAHMARKRMGTRYTRVSGRERVLEWAEGEEPDAETVRATVQKKLDGMYSRSEKLASVLKPLCKRLTVK